MTWAEVIRRWDPLLDAFRSEGFELTLSSVAFPVQLEGKLPDGEPFYFRERSGRCFLGVGGAEPHERPLRSIERVLPTTPEEPAFLEPEEAVLTLRTMLSLLGFDESIST